MSRHIRRTALLLCAALLCAPVFFACGSNTPAENTTAATTTDSAPITTAEPEDDGLLHICEGGESEYVIIFSEDDLYGRTAAFALYRAIREKIGVSVDYKSDSEISADNAADKELLVGRTDRDESSAMRKKLSSGEYGIKCEGERVVINGRNEECMMAAVQYFVNALVNGSDGEFTLPRGLDVHSSDTETQPAVWESNTSKVSDGGYMRIIALADGDLMAAYSQGRTLYVRRSHNGGKGWDAAIAVTTPEMTAQNVTATLSNANVFEMKDGTLMFAYRAHTPTSSTMTEFYTSIRFRTSTDGGKTWSAASIVAENTHKGSEFTGFWEPHMCYLADGKLGIYYANDCIGGDAAGYPFVKSMTYQHIMLHIYDESTGTFGKPIIASNGENHNSRDGMPVICTLSDGSYVMVIESSAERSQFPFIIKMLFSRDGIEWGEPVTVYSPTVKENYAGAPYVTLLADGRIAVSCQATQYSGTTIASDNVHNSTMNVIISNFPVTYENSGSIGIDSFTKIRNNPFTLSDYAVWPGMCEYDGMLLCYAELGNNNINGGTSGMGLYLRRATLNALDEN